MRERVDLRSTIFHLAVFLVNVAGIYWDFTHGNAPAFERFGGRARFLTHLTEFLCLLYSGFAFFVDFQHLLLATKNGKHKLVDVRDFLFAGVVSPLTIMIPLLFWVLAYVDLDGVMPPEHRKVVVLTGAVNQFLHTWPLIFNLACTILVYHHYPRRTKGLLVPNVIGLTYISWLFYIKYHDGAWVYPFLGKLSSFGMVAFFGGSLSVMAGMYIISEKLNENVWGESKKKLV